jgi:predicted DNA-binding transcriptional regulator YafY
MSRASNHHTLARQWELLKRLPTRAPGITAREMTAFLADQGHTVTKRTVERDLMELAHVFGIYCDEDSKPYGWHWVQGSAMDFGSIELTDAVSLALAEQLLKEMLPASILRALTPKFDQARKKLAVLEKNPMARLTQKVRFIPPNLQLRPPSLRESILTAVQEALVEERQITVTYSPFNAKPRTHLLNPLSLVQRGTVPYLVATVSPHPDPRIFAIHRIEEAIPQDTRAIIPKGYSVDAYIREGFMHFGSAKPIRLKARLTDALASYLMETPISETQKIDYKNNTWKLQATVPNTWQLHFWILSQGPEIEILAPKALKDNIRLRLKSALANYK